MTNVNTNNIDDAAICEIADTGVARIILNRPDIHNAFDDALIADLTAKIETLDADPAVRVVILTGAGKSFSAGADLNWMKRMATYSHAENLDDSRALAKLMKVLNFTSKPTIALVNGAAFGGGVGLAKDIGLVHEVVPGDDLTARGDEMAQILLANGPQAMHAAKNLIYAVANTPISDAVIDDTAHRIADQRASAEGSEGLSAFLEKRPANWSK